jgi:hypothetical protein
MLSLAPRLSVRHVLARAAVCLGALTACGLMVPATSSATQRIVVCGHVQGTVAVSTHGLTCSAARRIANDYLGGKKNPAGFRCRRYKVDAAAGWQAKCTRRATYVQIVPE